VLQSPAMQQKLKQLAVDPFPMRPEQFDQYVVKDLDTNGRLFRTATKK
jgi:tripartite-type tricarboxylate transporter receptor subunit TctC